MERLSLDLHQYSMEEIKEQGETAKEILVNMTAEKIQRQTLKEISPTIIGDPCKGMEGTMGLHKIIHPNRTMVKHHRISHPDRTMAKHQRVIHPNKTIVKHHRISHPNRTMAKHHRDIHPNRTMVKHRRIIHHNRTMAKHHRITHPIHNSKHMVLLHSKDMVLLHHNMHSSRALDHQDKEKEEIMCHSRTLDCLDKEE